MSETSGGGRKVLMVALSSGLFGLVSGLVVATFTFEYGRAREDSDVCTAAVSLLAQDVANLLDFDEKTRPDWDEEMRKLLEQSNPLVEGSRRWIMPDYRLHPLANRDGLSLARAIPSEVLEPTMRFYGVTTILNTQIVKLSGEPVRHAHRDDERSRLIDENHATRQYWADAAATLAATLDDVDCTHLWGLI